jgi:4-alpha-glucanotransferase
MDERVRKADVDSERINIPAIANHYWRYRMHLSVEQLLEEKELNAQIKGMIAASGR